MTLAIRNLLVIAAFEAGFLWALSFPIKSLWANLKEERAIYAKEISRFENLERLVAERKNLEKKRETLALSWKKARTRIPEKDAASVLLKQVVFASEKSGVRLVSVSPGGDGTERTWSVHVEGWLSSIGEFFNRLEEKSVFLKLKNIQVRPISQEANTKIQAILQISAFIPPENMSFQAEETDPVSMARALMNSQEVSGESPSPAIPYKGMAQRSIFLPAHVILAPPKPPEPPPTTYELSGTVPDAVKPIAIIKDLKTGETFMVSVGATLSGGYYTVLEITKTSVTLQDNKRKETLTLTVSP